MEEGHAMAYVHLRPNLKVMLFVLEVEPKTTVL